MGWVGGAISGIGSIVGGVQQAGAQKRATELQAKAAADALAFSKQQEADRKAAYEKSMGLYEQQWNAREAAREALLKRYGFDIGSSGAAPGMAGAVPAAAAGAAPMAAGPGAPGGGTGATAAPAGPMTGATLGDIATQGQGEWNDWARYGLKR